MARNISNSEDILDSRDVIARVEELESEQEDLKGDWDGASELTAPADYLKWEKEYGAELDALRAFIDDGDSRWQDGETLIHESYFEDYAQELAEDLHGDAIRAASWPFNTIDWERAAEELQQDYTGADFDGVTYYYRS